MSPNPNPRYYHCETWIINFEQVAVMSLQQAPADPATPPPTGRYAIVLVIFNNREQTANLNVPHGEVEALFTAFEQWLSQR